MWIATNCAALVWIDVHESRILEAEFHVPAPVIRTYESRTVTVPLKGGPVAAWYRFRPAPWAAGPRAVPLVIFLHGAGECGSDNVQQLRGLPSNLCGETLRRLYPCAVLVPQCPKPGGWSQRFDPNIDLMDCILRMIDDVLADSRIDPDRIYLTGISMGGNGTWELAMRDPARFAALVPCCGWGDESRIARLVHVPVWAVHGASDNVIPVSRTQTMIAALRRSGGDPRYLEMPGVGHNCWEAVFRPDSEVLTWMFRQRQE